jgi:hypothetical protein
MTWEKLAFISKIQILSALGDDGSIFEHEISSHDPHAIDYLLKPIEKEKPPASGMNSNALRRENWK